MSGPRRRLRVLAVDDEPPALDELGYLLDADPRVESVVCAGDAATALRVLLRDVDAVFLDIRMPGTGRAGHRPGAAPAAGPAGGRVRDRARRPGGRRVRPRRGRLPAQAAAAGAAGRVAAPGRGRRARAGAGRRTAPTTTRSSRSSWPGGPRCCRGPRCAGSRRRATTPGCTPPTASHLIRVPLSVLAERWADAGFVRIHRSYLVSLRDVRELRLTGSGYVVSPATASCRSSAGTPASSRTA